MVYSTRRFAFSLALCYFIVASSSPFSIANTSFGKERANLCAFRTFVRLALVWLRLFPLHFYGWDWLGLLLELLLYHVVAVKSLSIHHHIVWLQTLTLFFFSFFFFFLFFFFFFFFELSWIKEDYDKKNNVEKERIRHKTKTTGASLIIIVQVIFYFL